MADHFGRKVQDWADWWAEVATIAEQLPEERSEPPQEVAGWLFARFLELRRKDTTDDASAHLSTQAFEDILSRDREFNDRYAREVAESAVVAARSSILSSLASGAPHFFPRPSVPDGEMITVRDGRIIAAGGTVSGQHHVRALGELLAPGRPYIFARCPECRAVFARKGRRLRCSLACTQSANDAKRSPTDRQEQNRKAARTYREKRKKQQLPQRSPRKKGPE